MWLDKLWEYKESISRPPVPDEAVAKVKDDIEYSNHLIKVHNVMNVLDLPNNQEEAFRKIVENNYDGLMLTSAEISFELESEIITKVENTIKDQGIEIEEFIQDALIKFINQNQLNGTNTLPDL